MSEQQIEWISTGEAARMLGYKSRDGFRLKFLGMITTMRLPSGHYRWSLKEVKSLRDGSVSRPASVII